MSHAHDKTYIASLGFSDPDKKDPRHDLACRYLARPEVYQLILKRFKNYNDKEIILKTSFEVPLIKGFGDYRTIIGFLDLELLSNNFKLIIEVKIQKINVSDILRQINFYAEFIPYGVPRYIVATIFPLSKDEIDFLRDSGIMHVFLGSKFDNYVIEQNNIKPSEKMFEL